MVRMLVVTSCTRRKAVRHPRELRLEDFRDPVRLRAREQELRDLLGPAGQMYTGGQHPYVMAGVRRLRVPYGGDAIRLRIVSAGYGLIDETRLIAPYNVSFSDMSSSEARLWAGQLGLPQAIRQAAMGFPLVIFLLGECYLEVIEPPFTPAPEQRLIYLAAPSLTARLWAPRVTVIPAGPTEAKKYRAHWSAAKGRMFELFAMALAVDSPIWEEVLADETSASFLRALQRGLTIS